MQQFARIRFAAAALTVCLSCIAPAHASSSVITPLSGSGDVKRAVLTYSQLFAGGLPGSPVDDSSGFGLPTQAAEPLEMLEGSLALTTPTKADRFTLLSDIFHLVTEENSPWKHLPSFEFDFVQSGSYLIPASQGLAVTGSPAWNYIIGPGRVWRETSDEGYTRASFPFALIQRNQNCVHNGEMTFLFSNTKSPPISNVYFQITQETCYPMKFNMWGVVTASYTPHPVKGANATKETHATELRERMQVRPLSALASDVPHSTFNPAAILGAYKNPEDVTTYGFVFNGVNYSTGCPTRFGQYAFCEDMRLPSYSIAKSVFAGVALMRLGQVYGARIYNEHIREFIPERFVRGEWDSTTFNHASDMATGNYNLDAYEADEDSPVMDQFLIDESYASKLTDAFAFNKRHAPPGTKWVYQSSATFILTQAMNAYLKRHEGKDADLFNTICDDIYKPLHLSTGALTTIRTDNSPTGAPSGYYGLFFTKDDIAKIGAFLNRGDGVINGSQVLEISRLKEALFRSANPANLGVPILGSSPASTLGARQAGSGKPAIANARRYAHGFWGRYVTPQEFPEYRCNLWLSLMSGYGGNVVALLPNGVTFYVFSDAREFLWVDAVREAAKLAPMCH